MGPVPMAFQPMRAEAGDLQSPFTCGGSPAGDELVEHEKPGPRGTDGRQLGGKELTGVGS
jgi:hypothetical protein